ncbi:MAG: hypothetical protein RBG13Loki_4300 [Promethearchaeota archaeon CR_4]|nr:MAG: hypothetical protein RBG13Loki_4300 [Candidatus Lokiarchaeota archaeon CR_4]
MEKRTAEELITYKLRRIQKLARKILRRWNEISADNFLAKARDGTHKNAENDAIDLEQLLLDEEKYKQLLERL